MKAFCGRCYRDTASEELHDWNIEDGPTLLVCQFCYDTLHAARNDATPPTPQERKEDERSERALVALEKIAEAFANLATKDIDINIHHHKAD